MSEEIKTLCAWLRANAVGRDEMYRACGQLEKQQAEIDRFQNWLKSPKDALVLKIVQISQCVGAPDRVIIELIGKDSGMTFVIPEDKVEQFTYGETFTYKRVD